MKIADLPPLMLPDCEVPLCAGADMDRIYDALRQKWVALTPEEWVRQRFVRWLQLERGYMRGRMGNEIALTLNRTMRRCDTVVYDGHCRPVMIIEYKAPNVAITQKVFDQIVRYNMVLASPYIAVSNGIRHFCCAIDFATRSYRFLRDIPMYSEIVSEELR